MRIIIAALLFIAVVSAIEAEQYPLSVTLRSKQSSTSKIMEVPNGSIFGIKRTRKVTGEVLAVQRQFQLYASDGTPCTVTATVLEDKPVLDSAQIAEAPRVCDEAESQRLAADEVLSKSPEQAAADAGVETVAPPLEVRIAMYQQMAYMTPRDLADLTPDQQRQFMCDKIGEKIDIQLDYERHGSHGIYNLDTLRHAGPAYCRAYLMSIN